MPLHPLSTYPLTPLFRAKQKIAKTSTTYACAVLIANQMATKLVSADTGKRLGAMQGAGYEGGERAILMPQLGDLWVTPRTVRVSLFKAGQGEGKRCVQRS